MQPATNNDSLTALNDLKLIKYIQVFMMQMKKTCAPSNQHILSNSMQNATLPSIARN